jgi:hypothetical protein
LIKQYFLDYNECLSNDLVFSEGGKSLALANADIHDWKITIAGTGIRSNHRTTFAGSEAIRGGRGDILGQLY